MSGPWDKYKPSAEDGPWRRYAQSAEPEDSEPKIGAGTAALRGIGGTLLDNAIGIPDFLARRAVDTLLPQIPGIEPTGLQSAAQQGRLLPLPRGQDIIPGLDEAREQHPAATAIGGAVGEGLSVLGGRQMLRRNVAPATAETGQLVRQIGERLTANPGFARAVSEQFQRGPMKGLMNAAGKSAEAGLEGAVLSVMQGGDPMEMAGYAAGTQVLGSAFLAPTTGIFSGGVVNAGMKLALSAAATMSVIQIAKSATPGGQNRILESVETGYDKILLGIALGGISAAAGMGRVGGRNVPIMTDAITAIPRGATLGILRDVLQDQEMGVDTTERALNALATDPMRFNKTQRTRMQRGLMNGTLGKDVNDMLKTDPRFAARLDGEPVRNDFLTRGQRKKLNAAHQRNKDD